MAQMTGPDEAKINLKKAQIEKQQMLARQRAASQAREEAARKKAVRQRIRYGIGLTVFLVIFSIAAFSWFILRDYKFTSVGGHTQLVARMSVPSGGSVTIDNTVPGKLTLDSSDFSDAVAYEYQISRFKNMAFGKTYRSDVSHKTIANLSKGKTYHVRVRVYKNNPQGRQVHGPWGSIRGSKVKKE